jgi:hypothetical protein
VCWLVAGLGAGIVVLGGGGDRPVGAWHGGSPGGVVRGRGRRADSVARRNSSVADGCTFGCTFGHRGWRIRG